MLCWRVEVVTHSGEHELDPPRGLFPARLRRDHPHTHTGLKVWGLLNYHPCAHCVALLTLSGHSPPNSNRFYISIQDTSDIQGSFSSTFGLKCVSDLPPVGRLVQSPVWKSGLSCRPNKWLHTCGWSLVGVAFLWVRLMLSGYNSRGSCEAFYTQHVTQLTETLS